MIISPSIIHLSIIHKCERKREYYDHQPPADLALRELISVFPTTATASKIFSSPTTHRIQHTTTFRP